MSQAAMISVIVPVFNAEAYIEQCIDSVLSQSYRDIELILVDDGSTDGSLQKCLRRSDDARVKIISVENHGVSYARNLGLQNASGKWIMFLDSDDYFLDNCLEKLMALVSTDTQEIIASYTCDGSETVRHLHETVSADSVRRTSLDSINNQLLPDFYEIKPMSLATCWAKLYLHRVIKEHGIRFHEDLRLSEDMLFNLDYLSCIEKVVVTDLPVLYYRRNMLSVTKVFNAGHLADRFRFFNILKERRYQDVAVHICSLLLFEICKIERYTKGSTRRQLERKVSGFLSENRDVFRLTGNLSLSEGRWQRIFYKAAAICIGNGMFLAGFLLLRCYSMITKGEINRITGNPER